MIWASRIWQAILLLGGALAALWGMLANARRQGRNQAWQEREAADARETAERHRSRDETDDAIRRDGPGAARERLRDWSRDA